MGLLVTIFGYVLYLQQQKAGIFSAYIIHAGIDIGEIVMIVLQNVVTVTVVLIN